VAALRSARFVKGFGTSGILTTISGDRFDEAVALAGRRFRPGRRPAKKRSITFTVRSRSGLSVAPTSS
jgi:hypothetical protein